MNSSLDSNLVNGQTARNKVRVKSKCAASFLSTDIFVYNQFGNTYKLKLENRDPRKHFWRIVRKAQGKNARKPILQYKIARMGIS